VKRRQFIINLLGGVAAWPVAWAQPAKKKARLGVLVVSGAEPFLSVLKQSLRDRGYVEGQNIQIELRSAQGKPDLLPVLAAELVRLKVDILVGWQTPSVHALKQATGEIPILMVAGDPVATGLVASLARPGGNITGVSATTAAVGGKTLELIREMLPSAKRVAVLANAADPFTRPFLEQIQQAGPAMALDIRPWVVRGADEFSAAFLEMAKWRADAVIVQPSLPRDAAITLALKHRLPSVAPTTLFPEAGGLMSYAASIAGLYGEVAVYVDRILKGAKPADLPIQQPTTFELVVNLKTAKALGISVPRSLLLRADKVIE
jgi:putative tryptophan/tyrosine transport system substrate-binding protein